MQGTFNTDKWFEYLRRSDKAEVIDALDNVLFSATVHYLEPSTGCPSDDNVEDVICVRLLLEKLRECMEGLTD